MPYSFALLLLLLLARLPAQAQKYITAGGMRFDKDQLGITVQQRVLQKTTIEAIGMAGRRELSATLLGQQHFRILGRRLNYYLGAGAHLVNHKDTGTFYGFDGILGIEYKVNGLPFLLSFDVKPAVHINHPDWVALPTCLSVRYVFIKEKKPKQNFFQRIFKRDSEDTGND